MAADVATTANSIANASTRCWTARSTLKLAAELAFDGHDRSLTLDASGTAALEWYAGDSISQARLLANTGDRRSGTRVARSCSGPSGGARPLGGLEHQAGATFGQPDPDRSGGSKRFRRPGHRPTSDSAIPSIAS
jgi:hypothetical protein